jgi:F0F1-type ATP synthase membrane subunit b/b'
MKTRCRLRKISLVLAVLLWPGCLFAAEGEQAEGSWFALIFYAINFLLFLWIVNKYGVPHITQFFRDRSRLIRDNRARAENAHHEAQELANRAARLLGQLEAEKLTMKTDLDHETSYQLGQIKKAAEEAVSRIHRDTEITRLGLRDGAQRRLRQTMADAAGRLARGLVRRNFQPSDQAQLLSSFVDRIGEETRP